MNLERDGLWAHKDDIVSYNIYGECSVTPRGFGITGLVVVDERSSAELVSYGHIL